MMQVPFIIPARLNSSRFPGKLLKKVRGKTILEYTFEQAKQSRCFSQIFVATDDLSIAATAKKMGAEILWTSSNPKDGTERIAEALSLYPALAQNEFLLNLQADHPLIQPSTIEAVVKALVDDPDAMVATAVCPIQNESEFLSPHTVKCVFDQSHRALYFSRSPIPFSSPLSFHLAFAHIGIYAYRTRFFNDLLQKKSTPLQNIEQLEQLKVLELGYSIKVAIVQEAVLGIDTPEDLQKFSLACH